MIRPNFEDIQTIAAITAADRNLESQFSTWRKQAFYNYKKVAGYIFTEEEQRKLKSENRPAFVANLFVPILLQLGGNFKNSQGRVVATPTTPDDYRTADILTDTMDWAHYEVNDLQYQLARGYLDALIGRVGWVCEDWSYKDDPMGRPWIRRYDPFRLKFDPTFTERDLSDCKYIIDSAWYSYEELMTMFSHIDPALADLITERAQQFLGSDYKNPKRIASWAQRLWSSVVNYVGGNVGYDEQYKRQLIDDSGTYYNNGLFKTLEMHERKSVTKFVLIDSLTGAQHDITDAVTDDYGKLDSAKMTGVREQFQAPTVERRQINQVFQTIVTPALNISPVEAPAPLQRHYKYVPVWCFDFDVDNMENKSYIDVLTDPVLSYNKRRNTMLEYLMRTGLGETWAESGAFANETQKQSFLQNIVAGVKEVAPGAITGGKIKRLDPAPIPTAFEQFAQEDIMLTKVLSGVRDNAMGGQESSGESGIVFQSRVVQSDVMQAWVQENAVAQMKLIGHITLEYIQKYMTMERLIRITGDNGDERWVVLNQRALGQILNDVSVGEYDITLSKAPFGTLAKEREFNNVLLLANTLAKIDPSFVDVETLIMSSPSQYKDKMLQFVRDKMKEKQIMQQQAAMQQQVQQTLAAGGGAAPGQQVTALPEGGGSDPVQVDPAKLDMARAVLAKRAAVQQQQNGLSAQAQAQAQPGGVAV